VLRVTVSPGRIGASQFGPGIHAVELLDALARTAADRAEITYQWWGRPGTVEPDLLFPRAPRPRVKATPLPTSIYRHLHRLPEPVLRPLLGRYDVFHHFGIDLDAPAPDDRLVVSLHDLIGRRWPESGDAPWPGAKGLLHRAERVITLSAFSKAEIVDEYQLADERVVVVPGGCDTDVFRPDAPLLPGPVASVGGRPYVLMVGGATARKNVGVGVAAFEQARADHPDLLLVLTGAVARGAPDAVARLQAEGAAIDLGLPVIEAFAAGCPVVTTDAPAIAEVAGGLAEVVDGSDVDAMAAALSEVVGWTDDERDRRAALMVERAARFRWDACAALHLDVYEAVGRKSEV
jgi:glycosyltransferase involved in cell wall biosynthesis